MLFARATLPRVQPTARAPDGNPAGGAWCWQMRAVEKLEGNIRTKLSQSLHNEDI